MYLNFFRHLSELENQFCTKLSRNSNLKNENDMKNDDLLAELKGLKKGDMLAKLKSWSLSKRYRAVKNETIGLLEGVSSRGNRNKSYPSIQVDCDYTVSTSCPSRPPLTFDTNRFQLTTLVCY